MLNFLQKVILRFLGSKFAKFLLSVFEGSTGVIIDNSYKIVNEVVKSVELAGEEVEKQIIEDVDALIKQIDKMLKDMLKDKFNIDLSEVPLFNFNDFCHMRDYKSNGKFELAYKVIEKALSEKMIDYTKQAISLAIEFAVNRFFKK